jgi:predicted transcriptional regulator
VEESKSAVLSLAAQIVSAHVANNGVSAIDLPALINRVHSALMGVELSSVKPPPKEPAVNVKRSVRPDKIICLECGKAFLTLRRHLGSDHKLTPEEYRQKWALPRSYPLVAPDYAEVRSRLAKKLGLGRKAGYRKAAPAKRGRKLSR